LASAVFPMSRVVFPGDVVGVAEEFVSGPGTYEENGEVLAATFGRLVLDTSVFEARVEPFVGQPAAVKIGDIVLGTVNMTRSSMAIVEVRAIAHDPNRAVAGDTNGTLHVSKAADQYLESMEAAFRVRDIVRAKVLEVSPAIQLTTKGPFLGVLKSYCPRCGTAMARKGRGLVCPECEWKETSKIAEDYGEGVIM
ncbi:MAG TPA: exosome complex RNA-binding protein Csl4, partial [Candidatus Thermoplasmatota archaeon]|nr:exosome complex RNA-binding protein Csl4 [Candidatus Thermoplasmatota archaeon]